MARYFYDLMYSVDDDNFYASVFGSDGVEVYDTPVFSQRKEAIRDVLDKYPNAELLKEFT